MSELIAKNAFITGASRGIGRAIALKLAENGANVALTYSKSKVEAQEVIEKLESYGVKAIAIQADATKSANVVNAVQKAARELGSIDILVNNAGIFELKPVNELTLEDYYRNMSVNVEAVYAATIESIKSMPEGGRILTMGSVNGDVMPFPGGSVYAMTKAAVQMFTRGIARELGEKKITANIIQPGPIDTDMNPGDPEKNPMAGAIASMTALKQYGTTEDVAELALFLASPRSKNITGASINIDGGMVI